MSQNDDSLVNPLEAETQAIRWAQTVELGYAADDSDLDLVRLCFGCGKSEDKSKKFSKCAKCQVVSYCSRDCQVQDWKKPARHKMACPSYRRWKEFGDATSQEQKDAFKEKCRNELMTRIRFYACPYSVYKTGELGKGFLFLQSDTTLRNLSLSLPQDGHGQPLQRSIWMHYLTLGEYDSEVCKDDFEMAVVRDKLQECVGEYNEEEEIVLLLRLRCGHVAVGRATLVPDFGICQALGKSYYSETNAGAIQLNLDDI